MGFQQKGEEITHQSSWRERKGRSNWRVEKAITGERFNEGGKDDLRRAHRNSVSSRSPTVPAPGESARRLPCRPPIPLRTG